MINSLYLLLSGHKSSPLENDVLFKLSANCARCKVTRCRCIQEGELDRERVFCGRLAESRHSSLTCYLVDEQLETSTPSEVTNEYIDKECAPAREETATPPVSTGFARPARPGRRR